MKAASSCENALGDGSGMRCPTDCETVREFYRQRDSTADGSLANALFPCERVRVRTAIHFHHGDAWNTAISRYIEVMLPGDNEPEDVIKSVPKGLYCVNFAGGQVDITNGNFVFSASESYLIENGKVTRPVRNATLIGNGPEAMKYVSMVGNDLKLDEGIGICGKEGQSVPVGVGIPTVRIDRMTVGGTA